MMNLFKAVRDEKVKLGYMVFVFTEGHGERQCTHYY